MRSRRLAFCGTPALLCTSACVSQPQTYAPIEDRRPLNVNVASTLSTYLRMNDPAAPRHFVRDIRPWTEEDTWRWTGEHPTLMLAAPKPKGVRFNADVTVPETSFRETGPVTITVVVNHRELGQWRFESPGHKIINLPVPDGWLRIDIENMIEMPIDKTFVAPGDDNKPRGFVLTSVGLLG